MGGEARKQDRLHKEAKTAAALVDTGPSASIPAMPSCTARVSSQLSCYDCSIKRTCIPRASSGRLTENPRRVSVYRSTMVPPVGDDTHLVTGQRGQSLLKLTTGHNVGLGGINDALSRLLLEMHNVL